jgi:hypothetical protein
MTTIPAAVIQRELPQYGRKSLRNHLGTWLMPGLFSGRRDAPGYDAPDC